MNKKIIIGSRGSKLALWQANFVKDKLAVLGCDLEIKIIKTKGDQIQDLSFDKIEGKGFFTKEIENALIENKIDLAVHSLKDLETTQPNDLILGAIPAREDASDCLLINKNSKDESQLLDLCKNAIVGTSSARRQNQIKLHRPDTNVKDLRGNVPTRISKLKNGEYDAILLAKAGLNRLKIDVSEFHIFDLSPSFIISAPAQGALGLQIRANDEDLKKRIKQLNDFSSEQDVSFERKILKGIQGGCHSPFGAYSKIDKDGNRITWVSYAKKVSDVPKRLVTNENNITSILAQLNNNHSGKKVWISRKLDKESIFKRITEAAKFNISDESLIKTNILHLEKLPDSEWVFFNSIFSFESVKHFKENFQRKKIGAFGNATSNHLKSNGLKVEFIGTGSPINVALNFSNLVLPNEVVFFPSSNRSLGSVQKELDKANKVIKETYQTNLIAKELDSHDYLIFTSPSNVEAYFSVNRYKSEQVISIGSSTTKALKNAGVNVVHQAYESTELALADTLLSLN